MRANTVTSTIDTTLGELIAAFYESAMESLGDSAKAERVVSQIITETLARVERHKRVH